MMGGDKGEGGNISPSPRLPFKIFNNGRLPLPPGERKGKVVVLLVSPVPRA